MASASRSSRSTPWSSYIAEEARTCSQWEEWNRQAWRSRGSWVRSKSTGRSKSNRRLLPRNSAWFNLARNSGWKTWVGARVLRPEKPSLGFRSNESIDTSFGVSSASLPVAALSPAVTYHVLYSVLSLFRSASRAPIKDKRDAFVLSSLTSPSLPSFRDLPLLVELRRDKQFSVFLRDNRRPVVYPQVSNYFAIWRGRWRW